MTGQQTAVFFVGVVLLLIGVRTAAPAALQIYRRHAWEHRQGTVTAVSAKRDRMMMATGEDYPVWQTESLAEELRWHIRYSYVVDSQEHTGSSRHRALPPPAVGRSVPVLVHSRIRTRSQFDEPESPRGRLLVGSTVATLAAFMVSSALGLGLPFPWASGS